MPNIPDADVEASIAELEALEAAGVDVTATLRRLRNHAPRRAPLARSSTSVAPRLLPHVHNVDTSSTLNPAAPPFAAAAAAPFAAAAPPFATATAPPFAAAAAAAAAAPPFAAGTLQEPENGALSALFVCSFNAGTITLERVKRVKRVNSDIGGTITHK
ncbi:hypothetical protein B0H16DRAFT_1722443 [Mycena metata]|uniref:Uncharacterized protein n=1 Tax=Mycena metata TaxID=1033252 RepID=A0AAD7H5I7_9AGAR|nr:hypothetical protein B0H16DRAFT_1744563 [Mycena metata]KAJ7755236.1 hypothetical protein B0H16DRAFT_1722443 [Mycena metata]